MVDETTATGGDDPSTTGTTTKRRPWEGRFGSGGSGGPGRPDGRPALEVKKIRIFVARVLWAICAVCAVILAIAVLLIAVDANPQNDLVRWMVQRADNVDLGFFDLQNPIKDWDEKEKNPAEDVKTALFNYGIAAIVWLGIGKLLDRVVRP
jgi:hypothetical protein